MNQINTNKLLMDWRYLSSYVKADLLADLRDNKEPAAQANIENQLKDNQERINSLESFLLAGGVDPFKSAIARFLFVDTESSNCFNDVYKMCEYGHLMTNISFEELPRGRVDILMNPGKGGVFNLTGRKGHRDLVLAHSHREYKRAPLFEEYHDNISFWLKQESALVFMWASENDIQALLDQCDRYKMTKISFVSYDVQQIFMQEFPDYKDVPSLEKASAYLGLNIEGITQHRPDEDSLITMMILKAIVEKTGKSVIELIRNCPDCQYESTRAYASMKKRHKENSERRKRINKQKSEFAPLNAELNELLSAPVPEGTPKDKIFSVSLEMKIHINETLPLIKEWVAKGYYLKRNLDVAYLVAYNEEDRDRLMNILNTDELKIVLIDEYEKIIS